MNEYKSNMTAAERFKALSEEQKINKIYHHAMMNIQCSLLNHLEYQQNQNGGEWPDFSEYIEYLKAVIDYLCTKTGYDPKYLYQH